MELHHDSGAFYCFQQGINIRETIADPYRGGGSRCRWFKHLRLLALGINFHKFKSFWCLNLTYNGSCLQWVKDLKEIVLSSSSLKSTNWILPWTKSDHCRSKGVFTFSVNETGTGTGNKRVVWNFHIASELGQGVEAVVPHCSSLGSVACLGPGSAQCEYTISVRSNQTCTKQEWVKDATSL